MKKIDFSMTNHWKCLHDWIEFRLFDMVIDIEKEYFWIEIVLCNFEFSWSRIK